MRLAQVAIGTLLAVAVAVAVGAAGVPLLDGNDSTTTASAQKPLASGLVNCVGESEIRPTDVVLARRDANISPGRVHWVARGGAQAVAIATLGVNDCSPSCVQGGTHFYPGLLRPSRPRSAALDVSTYA